MTKATAATNAADAGKKADGVGDKARQTEQFFWKIIIWTLAAYLAGLVVFAGAAGCWGLTTAKIIGIGVLAGAASAVVGGFVGFLFGMPRSFQQGGATETKNPAPEPDTNQHVNGGEGVPQPAQAGATAEANAPSPGEVRETGWANNNLAEVSDWLTKIVIGVSLVEAQKIIEWVGTRGEELGTQAGLLSGAGTAFGVSVLVLNFFLGLLVLYIFSRTLITMMFAISHRDVDDALNHAAERQQKSAMEVKEQLREVAAKTDVSAAGVEQIEDVLQYVMVDPAMEVFKVVTSLFNLVNSPPPDGYTKAITYAREFLGQAQYAANPMIWVYLAAAYGQKFGHEGKLVTAADEAYNAAQKAIEFGAASKSLLRRMWDPADLNRRPNEALFLQPLFDDPDQKKRFAALFD